MKKRVCVIGMGRFGMAAAKELYQAGHDVLAIDNDYDKVQSMLGHATYAVRIDATSEESLRDLGVQSYDAAILALGDDNVQSSMLIAMVLRGLGIPLIIARAANEIHGDALDRIGVSKVVYPEEESAMRLAHVDFNIGILDYMEIATRVGITKVRPQTSMVRKTLENVGLSGEGGAHGTLSVVVLRRGRNYIVNPSKDEEIQPGDVLIVVGPSETVADVFTSDGSRQEAGAV